MKLDVNNLEFAGLPAEQKLTKALVRYMAERGYGKVRLIEFDFNMEPEVVAYGDHIHYIAPHTVKFTLSALVDAVKSKSKKER